MIYSYKGRYPEPLPYRIRLSDGRTRTDPSSFTEEELADAGYVPVDPQPEIREDQIISWNTSEIRWEIRNKTQEELQSEREEKKRNLIRAINEHRDRLISDGFWFKNIKFDSRPEDQKRISGASLLAFMAISQGAQPSDYLWHGGSEAFSWIAQDNSTINMDAFDLIEFGKTAAEHERAHIFAARHLKDMDPIPEDYNNTAYWPTSYIADSDT